MRLVYLHAKDEIEAFLRQNTGLHLYELGDLDDFFWQHTTWAALKDQGKVRQVCLIYAGTDLPVLLGLASEPITPLKELLHLLVNFLPRRFYAHLSGDAVQVLSTHYQAESHGLHDKMTLTDPTRLAGVDTSCVTHLSGSDLADLEALYTASYPGNWFDPRMLETGFYFGIRRDGRLVSVAGVHVYSQHYRVAVLGNITTHPQLRGLGLGKAVSARLCQALLPHVDVIGLNVKADNHSAIACYQALGFEPCASYEEFSLEARDGQHGV